jgi:hypothetical protein
MAENILQSAKNSVFEGTFRQICFVFRKLGLNWVRFGFVFWLVKGVKIDVTAFFGKIYVNFGVFKIGFVLHIFVI